MKKAMLYGMTAFAVIAMFAVSPLAAGWVNISLDDVSGDFAVSLADTNGYVGVAASSGDLDGCIKLHDLSTDNVNSQIRLWTNDPGAENGAVSYTSYNIMDSGKFLLTETTAVGDCTKMKGENIDWCTGGVARESFMVVAAEGGVGAGVSHLSAVGMPAEEEGEDPIVLAYSHTAGAGFQYQGIIAGTVVDCDSVAGFTGYYFGCEPPCPYAGCYGCQ